MLQLDQHGANLVLLGGMFVEAVHQQACISAVVADAGSVSIDAKSAGWVPGSLCRVTNQAATVALTVPISPMPTIMTTVAMTRPAAVTGV